MSEELIAERSERNSVTQAKVKKVCNEPDYPEAMMSALDYCRYWMDKAHKLEKENMELWHKIKIIRKAIDDELERL